MTDFESDFGGDFKLNVFHNTLDNMEHVALVKGRITPDAATIVRVHRVDFLADVTGQSGGRSDLVKRCLERIASFDEPGVMVFVRMGGNANIAARLGGVDPSRPDESSMIMREYGVGAQMLKDLGVRKMILLSNHKPSELPGLDGHGLSVEGWRPIDGDQAND